MSKRMLSPAEEAIQLISSYCYEGGQELKSGLPNGSCSDLGFDETLILEIAQAFSSWQSRINSIKDPYTVWYYDGNVWSRLTKDLYQEDAYKEWYRLTRGGKQNNKASCETYYFLGSSNLKLVGRHEQAEEGDDFSIKYLLSKSFGD